MRAGLANVESPPSATSERERGTSNEKEGTRNPEWRTRNRTQNRTRTMKVNTNRELRRQKSEQPLTLRGSEISDRKLQISLAVIDVVFERERQVDGGAMLGNEAFAL